MKIERATVADVEEVGALFNAYRMFYEQGDDVQGATEFIRQRLTLEQSIIFVAVHSGQFIGFTQLYPTFSSVAMKEAYILNDLFVAEDARCLGAGELLLKAAFRYAEERGSRFIALETGRMNTRAQALYEKAGMVVEDDVLHYVHYFG